MAVVNRRVVSNEIRDRLAAEIDWINGVEVVDRTVDPPCIVVHPIQGGSMLAMLDTTLSGENGSLPYQLTCVGVSGAAGRDQAEQLAADAVAALIGWTSGVVERVGVDAWGNALPDRDTDPPLWLSHPMVRVTARTEES